MSIYILASERSIWFRVSSCAPSPSADKPQPPLPKGEADLKLNSCRLLIFFNTKRTPAATGMCRGA